MGLRDIGATLPPGFRFYPNDEELVCHYLSKKIANEEALKGTLVEIDLHTCEPWQLPEVAKLNTTEWYFFSFRDRKYATGYRTNRATTSGYWKATGKDRVILDPITRETVGMRKTLVFYRNRAPNGIKTGWIMHEFRLESPHMPPKEDWVLCRVFHKSKAEENSNDNNHCQHMHEHHNTASTSSPHTCFTCQQPNNSNNNNNNNNTFSSNNPNLPPPQHHVDPIIVSLNNNNNMNNAATTTTTTTNNNNNNLPATLLNPNNPNNNNNNSLLNLINKEGNTSISWSDFMKNDDEYGYIWDMDLDDNKLGEGLLAGLNNVPPNCLPQLEFADQLGFNQDGFSGCVNF